MLPATPRRRTLCSTGAATPAPDRRCREDRGQSWQQRQNVPIPRCGTTSRRKSPTCGRIRRKAQLCVQRYKAEGGGYKGRKDPHNHLAEWTKEEWGTKSGDESLETGERYLPKKARDALTEDEYARTSDKKRADLAAGHQFSAQPGDVAAKTAAARLESLSKADLMKRATQHGVTGRSRMTKAKLAHALAHHG